ncbi:MAG TPA: hypothetical protein VFE62_03425 [Gemmataceae bacterium]|nr:hypothetical protein [Gemmataceae bacterium]
MDRPTTSADGSAGWTLPLWAFLLGAAALCAWHGWLTLSLFGDDPWERMLNDQPIVSGSHPQGLYIGHLGSQSLANHGRSVVCDFSSQALWPKTPIFDGGRLAEFFLLVAGGSYQPAAYKVGFAITCMLVPFLLLAACKSVGLGNGTTLLATLLGLFIWWGPHGRTAIVSGDCEVFLASLSGLAHIGFLISFHRTAGVLPWFGMLITGCLGWFFQPLLFPIALPILLTYYLSVGVKHDFLTWHFAFWGVEMLAVAFNLPWLMDWFDSWWLRAPLPAPIGMLEHRTFATLWHAPLWGGPANRALAVMLIASAVIGAGILNQTHQRPAARLLGGAGFGALVLALLGISWEPLGVLGTAALFAPALWFACLPAAHAWTFVLGWLWRHGKIARTCAACLPMLAAGCFVYFAEEPCVLFGRCTPAEPFEIGLNQDREAIVQALISHTEDNARILWEDRAGPRTTSRWSALLPLLTQRRFIGALDPDGFIEHSSICLSHDTLDGRDIDSWSDEGLADYCRRYNVRWIVAWTPEVIDRLNKWERAKKIQELHDGTTGWLYEVTRRPTYALKGQAEIVSADSQQIMLKDVVPHDGMVVLSMHYQAGMRALPGRVQIERATTGEDQIGFVRLRLAVPAAVVTLTWDR